MPSHVRAALLQHQQIVKHSHTAFSLALVTTLNSIRSKLEYRPIAMISPLIFSTECTELGDNELLLYK